MSDGVEIERKFLVSEMPEGLEDCPATEIVQGYLCLDRAQEVRLRASGGRHLQTVKGTGELERFEVEVEITAEVFAALWPATRGRRVEKTRYRVPAGEHVIDVDVYRGALSGLVTAERLRTVGVATVAELAAADAATIAALPGFHASRAAAVQAAARVLLAAAVKADTKSEKKSDKKRSEKKRKAEKPKAKKDKKAAKKDAGKKKDKVAKGGKKAKDGKKVKGKADRPARKKTAKKKSKK